MRQVLLECARARVGFDPDAVHDLRVALRRCRTMADSIQRVDPDGEWRVMKRSGRALFRSLGDLRDVQVMTEWVLKLGPPEDPLRLALLSRLLAEEERCKDTARRALDAFDRREWKDHSKRLAKRAERVLPDGPVFETLAIERWDEARDLHRRALASRSGIAWHRLRIGIKRFRYVVENFLPQRHVLWGGDLKRLQDLLGEVHDLDVLRGQLFRLRAQFPKESIEAWRGRIEVERQDRIREYRQRTAGRSSCWAVWREGLPTGERLATASRDRIATWASFLDPQPGRARRVCRLALGLFDAFGNLDIDPSFRDPAARRILEAAAIVEDVGRARRGRASHKVTFDLVSKLSPPPGWTAEEIRAVAVVTRYHRGREPRDDRGPLRRVPPESRRGILLLAGILRIANALDPRPHPAIVRVKVDALGEIVWIRAAGYRESAEAASRMGASKHLLERLTGRSIVVLPLFARSTLRVVGSVDREGATGSTS